jgi:hypothetical protein
LTIPWEIVYRVAAFIAVAALVVACTAAIATAQQSDCLNRILGQRANPAFSDTQANVDFALALQTLLTPDHPRTKPEAEQAVSTFVGAVGTYLTTLQTNQAYRAAHPLGKC